MERIDLLNINAFLLKHILEIRSIPDFADKIGYNPMTVENWIVGRSRPSSISFSDLLRGMGYKLFVIDSNNNEYSLDTANFGAFISEFAEKNCMTLRDIDRKAGFTTRTISQLGHTKTVGLNNISRTIKSLDCILVAIPKA